MVRSLLRESQIRDVDNMSETEHDEWIHVDLVTSGTVTFTDGNVSGTGNIYAGEYYGDGSNLTGIEHPTTTLSGVITNETYETATSTATDTITLDFDHADYGVAYIDGVRQQSDAYVFSGTDQIVFDEAVPSGTEVAFTHLVAEDTEIYYTQSQVDAIIATVSGALQAQIDQMLEL